jgi:hypothetical protein
LSSGPYGELDGPEEPCSGRRDADTEPIETSNACRRALSRVVDLFPRPDVPLHEAITGDGPSLAPGTCPTTRPRRTRPLRST